MFNDFKVNSAYKISSKKNNSLIPVVFFVIKSLGKRPNEKETYCYGVLTDKYGLEILYVDLFWSYYRFSDDHKAYLEELTIIEEMK